MTDEWVDQVLAALDLGIEFDADDILDLARDVAHGVERKAAPVATFITGLAAGKAGGDKAAITDAIARVRAQI